MTRGVLVIICGLSFAGKSTLGKALADNLSCDEVDVDETKIRLYGPEIQDQDMARDDWERIYRETDRQIEACLRAGEMVLDASRNFSLAEREVAREIATRWGAQLVVVYVDTPENVVRRRWNENRRSPSRRDVSESDFADVIRAMQPPVASENPLVFHFEEDMTAWIEANRHVFFDAGRLERG